MEINSGFKGLIS